jgi:YfiH family protein
MNDNKLEIKQINDLILLQSPRLNNMGFVKHFFSTKIGGVSTGEFENLNLGVYTEDSKDNILTNMNKIFSACGMDSRRIVYLNQIHSDCFFQVSEENYIDIKGACGDALITSAKGIAIGVFTADCVPVILVDSETKTAAVIHAGWKGTYKNIVKKVICQMVDKMGTNTDNIEAVIGPSIGPCCFEVGSEVAEKFNFVLRKEGRYYVDLWKENEKQIIESGVHSDKITTGNLCTVCEDDLFFSYRRDSGKTGRMGTFVEIV